MQVLIRCDASEAIGGGHAMRCLALGQELRRRGAGVTFAMADGWDMMAVRAAQSGIAVRRVSGADAAADLDASTALANELAADWLLVDGAALVDRLAAGLARQWRVLALDDRGFAASAGAQFTVLNTNVWASPADYPGFDAANLMLGLPFALLRAEFHRGAQQPEGPAAPRLLVLAGASDPTGFAPRLLRSLEGSLPGYAVAVVVGPMNRRRAELETMAQRMPRLHLHIDPPDLAALMRQCSLAVSASGGTLWELYALGIPAVAVVIADNQKRNAAWLERHGFPAVVADDADLTAGQLAGLAGDAEHRRNLASREQQLVDGRGVVRVADYFVAAAGGSKRKAAV